MLHNAFGKTFKEVSNITVPRSLEKAIRRDKKDRTRNKNIGEEIQKYITMGELKTAIR
jgi:hypothetical protein